MILLKTALKRELWRGLTHRNVFDRFRVKDVTIKEGERLVMSILFIVLYLALPIGLAALALLGCRPADEEVLGAIEVFARKERRR